MIENYLSGSDNVVFLMSNINESDGNHYKGFSGVGNELIKIYNLKKLIKNKKEIKNVECIVKYPDMWEYFLPEINTWDVTEPDKIRLKKDIDLLVDLSSYHDLVSHLTKKYSPKRYIEQFYLKNKQDYKIKTSSKLYKIYKGNKPNNNPIDTEYVQYSKNQYINWSKIFGVNYENEQTFSHEDIPNKCIIHVNSSLKDKSFWEDFLRELTYSIGDDTKIFIDYGKCKSNKFEINKPNVENLPDMSLLELIKFIIKENIPILLGPDTGVNQHLSNIIGNFSVSVFNIWDPINWIPPNKGCFYLEGEGRINTDNYGPEKLAKFVDWVLKGNSKKHSISDLFINKNDKKLYNKDRYQVFSNKYKFEKINWS